MNHINRDFRSYNDLLSGNSGQRRGLLEGINPGLARSNNYDRLRLAGLRFLKCLDVIWIAQRNLNPAQDGSAVKCSSNALPFTAIFNLEGVPNGRSILHGCGKQMLSRCRIQVGGLNDKPGSRS